VQFRSKLAGGDGSFLSRLDVKPKNKHFFRNQAHQAIGRARGFLESGDINDCRNAALELRMAIEFLTYDRLMAYSKELPSETYETWQPRKVLQLLLDIDPLADKSCSISFAKESSPGVQAEEMQFLGEETALDLNTIRENYDALGSFLHAPTIKQIDEKGLPDLEGLRTRCLKLASDIEDVLSSSIFNVTIGQFTEFDCQRCGKTVRRRLPSDTATIDAKCLNCGAPYNIYQKDGGAFWRPSQKTVPCPAAECDAEIDLWVDRIEPGVDVQCDTCKTNFKIGLALFTEGNTDDG